MYLDSGYLTSSYLISFFLDYFSEDDVIYEEVQRSGESGLIGNSWGSSEFESYDEQSDSETKQPTRNKVQIHCPFIIKTV